MVDLGGALREAALLDQRVSVGIECRLWPVENVGRSLEYLAPFVT